SLRSRRIAPMRMFLADRLSRRVVRASLFVALVSLSAADVVAQTPREIVSKSVTVGRDVAALELQFASGDPLSIALADGSVTIEGERVGTFESGDAVDSAWRGLLGFAVALDDGPLSRALLDWAPPEDIAGDDAEVAVLIDQALESALQADAESLTAVVAAPRASSSAEVELRSLVSLLDRTDVLSGLAEALEDLDFDDVRLSVGEDLIIEAGEDVDATVVVVDADLEVAGRVRGDVVVVDGDLRLAPNGRVDGDVRHAHGTVIDQGARVDGEVIRVEVDTRDMESRIRDEIRAELRDELRAVDRGSRERDRGESFMGRVFGGIGGTLGNLFSVVVIAVIGALVIHFAGTNLDAVAETARRTPGRALAVGTAGAFLILPAFVLGIVALAISIIGIPALILWIPLFPVAIVLGVGLGYLAVFRNVGIWASRQRFPYMSWVRITNPVTLVAGGALALTAPFILAELVSVFPWTGALEVLLRVTGVLLSMMTALLGFGAVLLTRGGRRPEFFDDDLFGVWGTGRRSGASTRSTTESEEDVWVEMETAADQTVHDVEDAVDEAGADGAEIADDEPTPDSEADSGRHDA
ncbi:MAG: polymer-forming cytoskeletal protein, partial [Gemmatimonadetes bacterium]|nr:polymer-forming cytoskeletal protein [Gemmatimonadota bacterium]